MELENEYSRLSILFSEEELEKIKNAKVCVVGLGGVGSIAMESLARSGVGNLVLCDFDTVNITNINRQIIANHETIGKLKTKCAKELIENINPNINVSIINERIDSDNLKLFNNDFDYLIDAIDDIDAKILLYKECFKRNIKFISSMGTAKKLDPTKIEIISLDKTEYDSLAKIIRKKCRENNISTKIMVVSSKETPIEGVKLGSYMPVVSTAGLYLSDYIIKEIIK